MMSFQPWDGYRTSMPPQSPARPPRRRRLGIGLAALLGTVFLLLRRLGGRRERPPTAADGGPPPPGSRTVLTEDGVPLHVEVDDCPGAPLTVVFAHGFTAQLGEFVGQRAALGARARLVLYDQRGHGRSGWGDVRRATIDQLGHDLLAVMDATTPTGPIVLVGHSMGGMTVMALADRHPELFGPRVVGVCLLATSAGQLVETGAVGTAVRLLRRLRLLGLYLSWLRLVAPLLERFRRRGTAAGYAVTRRYLFGRDDADPVKVGQVQTMLEETPFTITAAFAATFVAHDKLGALRAMRDIPVLVLDGADDQLTPAAHSRLLAAEIGPNAELVIVPGAGHAVNHTRPDIVDPALDRLLDRVESHGKGPKTAG